MGDVRIERAGNQRWLVVDRPPEKLWDPVRDFWQESGFLLTIDKPDIGIMETDWAENRAKIPQDIIRSTLGKVMEGAVLHRGTRQVPHPHGAHCPRVRPKFSSATAA